MKPSEIFEPQERLPYMMHSNQREFKWKVEKSENFIQHILKKWDRPFTAVSGGKDSMAMLHILAKFKPDIHIRHWDYGEALVPRNVAKEIVDGINEIAPNAKLLIKARDKGDTESARHSHIMQSNTWSELDKEVAEFGWNMCFIGLREDESNARRARIRESKNWVEYKDSTFKARSVNYAFPVAVWTKKDVWAYIFKHDIPIPEVYRDIADVAGGIEEARLSTFFDDEFKALGNVEHSGVMFWKEKEKYKGK